MTALSIISLQYARSDRPTPSCKEDGVENYIKGWYWNTRVNTNQPTRDRSSGGGISPISSRDNSFYKGKQLVDVMSEKTFGQGSGIIATHTSNIDGDSADERPVGGGVVVPSWSGIFSKKHIA